MTNKHAIESLLIDAGISDYRWINPRDIIIAQWVRVKCMFGCGDYGSGTCPPNTLSVDECRQFFGEYSDGLIIRLTMIADKEKSQTDWSKNITSKFLELEKQIFLSGYPKVFLLNHTCCNVCKDCSGNRQGCKDKRSSRPSPESFAVDVFQTVRNAGMEISVITENPSEINRIIIMLID